MPCRIEGCDGPVGVPGTAKGLCSRHYTRLQRHGDALYEPSPPATHCDVQGCPAPRWARGLCGTHYRRLMNTGAAGPAERMTSPAVGGCALPGCRRPVKSKGYCSRHYQRLNRHGSPTAGGTFVGHPDRCSVLGCERDYYARGLCNPHWAWLGAGRGEGAASGTTTADQMVARLSLFANRCWMCGGPADQVDHVKPLSAGGSNWPANLRPACRACNSAKAAKWPLPNVIHYTPTLQGVSA